MCTDVLSGTGYFFNKVIFTDGIEMIEILTI